jgi:sterol desaturase/sphingolipid hydroxylase (fatty acid hydroxylase superfamily)
MNFFALSFAIMIALVLIERVVAQRLGHAVSPWRELVLNLDSGHILMWIGRGMEVAGFGWLLSHASLHWVDRWPLAAQWIFAFIGWDFCFYWMHRLHHKYAIFWAVHVVHHEGEHFDLSLGIRNSWYSSLTSLLFVAILAVLGVPLAMFIAVSAFHYSVQFYNHTGLVRKSGVLDRFLVTPSNHRVHHGNDARYRNKNFGGTLLLWDKLFGTYQAELDHIPMEFGATNYRPANNPFWTNSLPFSPRLRGWFASRSMQRQVQLSDRFIGFAGVALFGLVIYFVNVQETASAIEQVVLFALIFGGTIALGALADGSRIGGIIWTLIALLSPIIFIASFHIHEIWVVAILFAMALSGLDCARCLWQQSMVSTRALTD